MMLGSNLNKCIKLLSWCWDFSVTSLHLYTFVLPAGKVNGRQSCSL